MSNHPRFKVGAVIVQRNKLISAGANQNKSHPIQKRYDRERNFKTHHNCHAEVRAILNSRSSSLAGCTLYCYRETKNGNLACSRPCPSCLKMIKDYGIKTICYTTVKGFYREILRKEG